MKMESINKPVIPSTVSRPKMSRYRTEILIDFLAVWLGVIVIHLIVLSQLSGSYGVQGQGTHSCIKESCAIKTEITTGKKDTEENKVDSSQQIPRIKKLPDNPGCFGNMKSHLQRFAELVKINLPGVDTEDLDPVRIDKEKLKAPLHTEDLIKFIEEDKGKCHFVGDFTEDDVKSVLKDLAFMEKMKVFDSEELARRKAEITNMFKGVSCDENYKRRTQMNAGRNTLDDDDMEDQLEDDDDF